MKIIATIPSIDGTALDLTREDFKPAIPDYPAEPARITLWDEEQNSMAVMPGTLDDSEAIQLAGEFVIALNRARNIGIGIGRRDEREKLTYGFRVLLEPLTEPLREAAASIVSMEGRR